MVCLGNICRSPLAEGIMRHLSDAQQLNWKIASAGTGNWHIGKAPDHRSVAAAKSLGYHISNQRAQQFNAEMFAQYDLIFVMDRTNLNDVLQLAKTEEDRKKVSLFLHEEELIDPYWDDLLFAPVCLQVEERCRELMIQIIKR